MPTCSICGSKTPLIAMVGTDDIPTCPCPSECYKEARERAARKWRDERLEVWR